MRFHPGLFDFTSGEVLAASRSNASRSSLSSVVRLLKYLSSSRYSAARSFTETAFQQSRSRNISNRRAASGIFGDVVAHLQDVEIR